MLIYYDWNYCDLSEDHKSCTIGSREECPKDEKGVIAYCPHFHVEKRKEDVER